MNESIKEIDQKTVENDPEMRKRILDAAREQFFLYGFSRVTVEEISDKLGMSKKTIYKYFVNKDDIVRQVAFNTMNEIETSCRAMMEAQGLSFVDRLRKMMTMSAFEYSKMRRTLVEDLQKHAPNLWKEISEFRSKSITNHFGDLLSEGMERGIFRKDIDRDLILLIYNTTMENVIKPDILMQIPYSAAQVFESIVKIMFEGILVSDAKPAQLFE
jgi:AcrR family transcriptional regulator